MKPAFVANMKALFFGCLTAFFLGAVLLIYHKEPHAIQQNPPPPIVIMVNRDITPIAQDTRLTHRDLVRASIASEQRWRNVETLIAENAIQTRLDAQVPVQKVSPLDYMEPRGYEVDSFRDLDYYPWRGSYGHRANHY